MYTHEIYTSNATQARMMKDALQGVMESYSLNDDSEMFIIKVTKRYGHDKMVQAIAHYDFEDVITNKL